MVPINFSDEPFEETVPLVYCYCFLRIKVERTESLLSVGLLFELKFALVVERENWFIVRAR